MASNCWFSLLQTLVKTELGSYSLFCPEIPRKQNKKGQAAECIALYNNLLDTTLERLYRVFFMQDDGIEGDASASPI